MGRTEEQGAIVTLQSKEKPAVGMAGHLLLTPGIWDLACLRSHKTGVEEEWVEGGGGGRGGSCAEAWTWLFHALHQPCWGKVQQVLVQPAQAHRNSWKTPGTMLGMPRAWICPVFSSWSPGHSLGQATVWGCSEPFPHPSTH